MNNELDKLATQTIKDSDSMTLVAFGVAERELLEGLPRCRDQIGEELDSIARVVAALTICLLKAYERPANPYPNLTQKKEAERHFQSCLRQHLAVAVLHERAYLQSNLQSIQTLLQASHLTDEQVLDALSRDREGMLAVFDRDMRHFGVEKPPPGPDDLW